MMKFLSASQDFERSLGALAQLMQRLQYVSQLREPEGYEHWGLIKCHGKAAAQTAMRSAHEKLFLELLRTPIRELAGEPLEESSIDLQAPENVAGGSKRHFRSIMMILRYLSQAARDQAHPAA
jgi:hypothetical protein